MASAVSSACVQYCKTSLLSVAVISQYSTAITNITFSLSVQSYSHAVFVVWGLYSLLCGGCVCCLGVILVIVWELCLLFCGGVLFVIVWGLFLFVN